MKYFTLTIILTVFGTFLFGQSDFKQTAIYLEAGGNGFFASLNWERQLLKQPGLGFRIGVGFYSEKSFYLTVPLGINYLFKLKGDKSFIDAGLSANWDWSRIHPSLFGNSIGFNGDHLENFVPSVGYRRHTNQKLIWRISFTPIVNKFGFVPWIGFSIGKVF